MKHAKWEWRNLMWAVSQIEKAVRKYRSILSDGKRKMPRYMKDNLKKLKKYVKPV